MTASSAPFLKACTDGRRAGPCALPIQLGNQSVGQSAPPYVAQLWNGVPGYRSPTDGTTENEGDLVASPLVGDVAPSGDRARRAPGPTLRVGRWQRGQRGAALVEFVIVFPILLTLVFSIWEAGRILDAWLIVTNAAREGARYAAATTDDTTVDTHIVEYLTTSYGSRVSATGGDVTIDGVTTNLGTFGGCGAPNDIIICRPTVGSGPVTVAITAHVEVFAPTPFAGLVGPDGKFDVHAWTTMEQ